MQKNESGVLLDVCLFDGLSVQFQDRVLQHFQTRQTASLLAYLATYPRRHSREELTDLLWPDAESTNGKRRLSQALSWIKANIDGLGGNHRESVILADRSTIALNAGRVQTDIGEFERLLKSSETSSEHASSQVAILLRAVELYGNDTFLPGFYDDWVLTERHRLLTLYLSALDRLARHYERAGDMEHALAMAERALAVDLHSEEAHYGVIRLLAASGETAAAQRQYRELQRVLADELDAEPSGATRALMQQIKGEVPFASAAMASAAPHPLISATPLPLPLTRFFGRDALIDEVYRTTRDTGTRVVTLTGTGGSGKTRLATEFARRVAAERDGRASNVAFTALADLANPNMMPETIAESLGLRQGQLSPLERIASALLSATSEQGSSFMLVLDNVEHLLSETAACVRELTERVPRLTILVTSRRRLGLEGEQEISIPPLTIPNAAADSFQTLMQSPSVQLFIDRARAVRPNLPFTPDALRTVAQLCERLEGLPLAIELCAA